LAINKDAVQTARAPIHTETTAMTKCVTSCVLFDFIVPQRRLFGGANYVSCANAENNIPNSCVILQMTTSGR